VGAAPGPADSVSSAPGGGNAFAASLMAPADPGGAGLLDDSDPVGAVGSDALAASLGSGSELAQHVARIGDAAAMPLLAALARSRADVVVEFIVLGPTQALAVHAFNSIAVGLRSQVLRRLGPEAGAALLQRAFLGGLLGPAAAALLLLDPSDIVELLKHMSDQARSAFARISWEEVKPALIQRLDEIWKPGIGMGLDLALAVSFGIPVKADAAVDCGVLNGGGGVLKVNRKGELAGGVVGAVGGGASVGLSGSGGGGIGVGAEGEAEAEAGLKGTVYQEFEFPIFDDAVFLTFCMSLIGVDNLANIVTMWSDRLASLESSTYNKVTRFDLEAFAEGEAEGEAGARTGDADTKSSYGWMGEEGSANSGDTTEIWQVLTSLSGEALARLGVGGWAESRVLETSEGSPPQPKAGELELGGSFGAVLEVMHSVPAFVPFLKSVPKLPESEGQLGLRAVWAWRADGGSVDLLDPSFESFLLATSGSSGAGAAVGMDDYQSPLFNTPDELIANLGELRLERTIGLDGELGSKIAEMAVLHLGLVEALGLEDVGASIELEGSIRFEAVVPEGAVQSFATELLNKPEAPVEDRSYLSQILAALTFGAPVKGIADIGAALAELVRSGEITAIDLAAEARAGLELEGKAGAGGKVGVEAGGGGRVFVEQNLMELYSPSDADLAAILRGDAEEASRVLVPA
jgi:hypothetical protein